MRPDLIELFRQSNRSPELHMEFDAQFWRVLDAAGLVRWRKGDPVAVSPSTAADRSGNLASRAHYCDMSIRYIFGGTFGIICYACYLGLIVVQQKMIDDVNRQLPPSERIGLVIASTTIPKVIRLHRQFYPSSNLAARF